MRHRNLAMLIALIALVGTACGGASTVAQTASPPPASAPTPAPTTVPATPAPTATVPAPAPTPQAGQMTTGRTHHTATALADGRVLVAGGYPDNTPMASADLYDPKTGTFSPTSPGG